MSDAVGLRPAPPSASARGYLSSRLPAVYRDPDGPGAGEPFVVRWMTGLEEVLDPIVTLVDNLAWHLDPGLAPEPIVRMLLDWLGLDVSAQLPLDGARRVLSQAESVARRRGTRRGMEEVLSLAFGQIEIDVVHSARFTVGDDPRECPDSPAPFMHVRWRRRDGGDRLTGQEEHDMRRLVEARLPVAVPYLLLGPNDVIVAR